MNASEWFNSVIGVIAFDSSAHSGDQPPASRLSTIFWLQVRQLWVDNGETAMHNVDSFESAESKAPPSIESRSSTFFSQPLFFAAELTLERERERTCTKEFSPENFHKGTSTCELLQENFFCRRTSVTEVGQRMRSNYSSICCRV